MPTADADTVSAHFLDQERRALPPDLYAQEYECAFGRAGRGLFTLDQIAAMASGEKPHAPLAALQEEN